MTKKKQYTHKKIKKEIKVLKKAEEKLWKQSTRRN